METRQRLGGNMSRSGFLRGGSVLIASAAGLGALAPVASADTPSAGDLAYLRLLIAAELLAVDFQGQALASGKLGHPASALGRRIRADHHAHYTTLAGLMTAAGQTPARAGDIDFTYPSAIVLTRRSVIGFAEELERVLAGGYIDALEHVATPGYREAMARILANEAQHHGALAALEGGPVVEKPFPSPFRMDALSNFLDRYES